MDEESIFAAVIEISSPHERFAYLDQVCAHDPALKARIEAVLRAHEQPDSFFEAPVSAIPRTVDYGLIAELPGTQIGPYKLLEQIGEGGMGIVYVASQKEPLRRKVALKIIKPGMDTREVVARFEAERQALALMDHPNIAKVFDAGATGAGRPYFAMELVKGTPITEYCDREQLSTRERLALFVTLCHGVQHAHQKGVIHRDLKPSNLLVEVHDVRPVPKIIDFGIAKAVGQQLTEKTFHTAQSQMVGTPLYMSPEQAGQNCTDVDTRSDIYSLGVVLYELLTGSTPFEKDALRTAGADEMRRIIREVEPPRPSARVSTLQAADLSTICDRRHIEPGKLSQQLRGDLDWIVMKAMDKDRDRRYESANALASDVQRYLDDEPVQARPPTVADRVAKWARRHRQLVGAAMISLAVFAVALAVSTVLTAGAYQGERDQRQLADEQRRLAEKQKRLAERQTDLAEQQRDTAEYGLYVAHMHLAQQDLITEQSERLGRLLEEQRPQPGRPDFRGWEWHYFFSRCHAERLALPFQAFHSWSPNGKYLATSDLMGGINIWDVATGRRKSFLKESPIVAWEISWSPNAEYLAAATDRGTVVIWEVASGKKLRSLMGQGSAVRAIHWSPDGTRLAAGEGEGLEYRWDRRSQTWRPTTVEIGEATIRIWDWRNGRTLSSLVVPVGPVSSLDWHPDGRQLLAMVGQIGAREVKIWDTTSGKEIAGWPAAYASMATFSPDGSRLVWGSEPVRVSDLKTRKVVSTFPHRAYYSSSWSPAGDRLASTAGGAIKVWDPASGAELASLPVGAMPPVVWSPVGELLAGRCPGDDGIRVWDTATAQHALTLTTAGNIEPSLAFSPDGTRLLAGGAGDLMRIYDVESGEVTLSLKRARTWRRCLAWSPDGKRVAYRPYDGEGIEVCDAKTGQPVFPGLNCEDEPLSLAFSPDGSILAVGLRRGPHFPLFRGRVKLFSATTGTELAASTYADGACDAVAWSPDGQRLAAVGDVLRIWDSALHPQTFAEIRGARCVAWSPDGKHLASGTENGRLVICDAKTGDAVHVQEGFGAEDVAWHPSMTRLASGGSDGMIHIWDTATGREVCALETHADINDLDWSSDGLRLAAACGDKMVRIWDASPADRFFKRHGDVLAKLNKLVAEYHTRIDKGESIDQEVMREEFEEALSPLNQLRTLHPEEEDLDWLVQHVEWFRAIELARAGETNEAMAIFRALAAESSELPDWHVQMPWAMFEMGREAQAIELLEDFLNDFPQRLEYREELAFLYECRAIQLCRSGEVDAAVPILRRLGQEFPERPGHRAQLVRQVSAQVPRDKAPAVFRRLIQQFPDAAEYQQGLARLLGETGQHDEAIEILRKLATDSPDAYQAGLAGLLRTYSRLGQVDEAIEGLHKLVHAFPDNRDCQKALASAYFRRADPPYRQDDLEQAFPDLERAIQSDPEYSEAYDHRGHVHLKRGDLDQAVADFTQAIRFGAAYDSSYTERAEAYLRKGDHPAALVDLTKAIELRPDSPRLWYDRALVELASGQLDEYRKDCAVMLDRFGSFAAPADGDFIAWACALAPDALSEWVTAVALAEKAARTDPKSAFCLNTWGAVLYRAGRFDEALARLSEAEALVQEPSEANKLSPAYTWFFLAMTQQRLGHVDEAKQWLDKAVAWTDKTFADADQSPADLPWNRRLTLKLLRDEATALLGVTPPAVTPAPEPAAKKEEQPK